MAIQRLRSVNCTLHKPPQIDTNQHKTTQTTKGGETWQETNHEISQLASEQLGSRAFWSGGRRWMTQSRPPGFRRDDRLYVDLVNPRESLCLRMCFGLVTHSRWCGSLTCSGCGMYMCVYIYIHIYGMYTYIYIYVYVYVYGFRRDDRLYVDLVNPRESLCLCMCFGLVTHSRWCGSLTCSGCCVYTHTHTHIYVYMGCIHT
jgi:hypothetical protein